MEIASLSKFCKKKGSTKWSGWHFLNFVSKLSEQQFVNFAKKNLTQHFGKKSGMTICKKWSGTTICKICTLEIDLERQFAGLSHDPDRKFANCKWWSSYCHKMVTVWVSHSCISSSLLGLLNWNYSLNKRCFCQPVVFLFCSPARHCRSWLWQLFLIQQYSRRISAPVRSANFLTMTWREYWTIIIHCPLQKDARWKAESQKAELL